MSATRVHIHRTATSHPPGTPRPTPCRLWQGRADRHGYAIRPNEEPMHRWVVRMAGADQHGTPWDDSLLVMHECDQPACYRFDHLKLGTHADNMADMQAKHRRKLPISHGTEAGYQQHRRRGEAPCEECRGAKRDASRRRRAAVKLRVAS